MNPVGTSTSVTSSSPNVVQGASVTFTARITPAQMGAAPVSGTVYLTANGIEIGNLTVSNSQAQATTSFPTPGSVQIQANYSGDANYTASSGAFTETVTLPPDFSLTLSGATALTVNAGQTATFTNAISVTPQNGFSAQVKLSCSLPIAAKATTCAVNPNTLASGSGTATVTVTTMVRGLVPPPLWPRVRFISWPQFLPVFLLTVLLSMLLLRLARTRRQRFAGALPLASLLLFLMLQAIGCGGSSTPPPPPPPPTGTPAGTYTVTVTATSGTLTHTTTLTLVVQ